jgi:hypothetical protein
VHHANGERREADVVPFVDVEPPGERKHRSTGQASGDERTCVAGDGRRGKAGHLAERNRLRVRDLARKASEPRTEDDAGHGLVGAHAAGNAAA